MAKERPILFSTPMVKAILEGRKTQTRRIIKSRHQSGLFRICRRVTDNVITNIESLDWDERNCEKDITCPYGKPGDILWVRESFGELYDYCDHPELPGCPTERWSLGHRFKADNYEHKQLDGFWTGWKPSIHMPRSAARIFLEITDIKIERLQDISEEDAKAEGVQENVCESNSGCPSRLCKDGCNGKGEYYRYSKPMNFDLDPCESAVESFATLWQSINGEDSWNQNPWVWVVSFKVIPTPNKGE